ncbi:MAG: DNRLRE domain-containing protein [Limisphaerales bacterium]
MNYLNRLILGLLGVAAVLPVYADTLTVSASTDTWILAENPFGNFSSDGHGLGAGMNSHGSPMRAMFKFDLSQIPANATVTSVSVTVTEIKESSLSSTDYELHRVLQSWVQTETTWNNRTAAATWNSAGLESGTDYTSPASGTITAALGAFGPNTFASTVSLVADVQAWIDAPSSNNGWLFKAATESGQNGRRWGSTFTAQFGAGDAATLSVTYTASTPPPQQPTLTAATAAAGQFQFSFNAEANRTYTVESRPAFDASLWTTLTTFPAASTPTNYVVTDSISQVTKFYRVSTP